MKKTATVILLLCLMPTTAMARKDDKVYILEGYLSCGQSSIANRFESIHWAVRLRIASRWGPLAVVRLLSI